MVRNGGWVWAGLVGAASAALVLFNCAGPSGGGGRPAQNGGTPDNANGSDGASDDGGASARGSLAGQVVDVSGVPLASAGVEMSVSRSGSTDENGFYSFDRLDSGAVVVRFAKAGYATNIKRFEVTQDNPVLACIVLANAGTPQMIDPEMTGTYTERDATVSISGGSLAMADGSPVTRPVELRVTKVDPSTAEVMTFPGSFETALSTAGEMVQLESFGFATYELSCDGEPVDLAPGQTAMIEYILPENAQDLYAVGEVIPRWEFNEQTAMWIQADPPGTIQAASDGSGRKAWVAAVDHFSSWNSDKPIEEKNCFSGLVVDDAGNPVVGASVSAVGRDYNGVTSGMTDSSGRFCLDVKAGSRVELQVRVNGAAAAIAVRELLAGGGGASCATGGCQEVSPPLSVAFGSCVRGRVTDSDGNPVADEMVYVVPGETVRTDSNGEYCARAPGGLDVYVFAPGRQSVKVRTPVAALCPSQDCVRADLAISLPTDGDRVGYVGAFKSTGSFYLSGAFFALDPGQTAFAAEGETLESEMIGECTVERRASSYTIDLSDPNAPSPSTSLSGFVALDPGNPARASNGTAEVDLVRGDPAATDPPMPSQAGIYTPDLDGEFATGDDLLALGFDAGQEIQFSWPGGVDIGPFSDTIRVPEELVVTAPNLADPNLQIDTSSDLNLTWVAGDATDTVFVSVSASTSSSTENADGTTTFAFVSVSIQCELADDGSGLIPAAALGRWPVPITGIYLSRNRTKEISVDLRRTGGTGIVVLTGANSVFRSFTSPPE